MTRYGCLLKRTHVEGEALPAASETPASAFDHVHADSYCNSLTGPTTTTKHAAYSRQTQEAKSNGVSNCPTCAAGDNANNTRVYRLNQMDADHVTGCRRADRAT